MDSMERLKKAVENIELDADARARISARLAGAKEPARPRRRIRAGVLVAAAAAAAAGSGLPSHNRSRGEGCAAPARLFSSGPAGPAPSPRFDKFLRLQTKSLFLNAFFAILLVFEAGFTMV